jgi:hydroxymethylbilane synthase
MPLAAHGVFQGDVLDIRAAWGDPDGKHALMAVQEQATVTDAASALRLGESVAHKLQVAVQAIQAKT